MRVVSSVRAVVCLAACVGAARPALASMTMVFRYGPGKTGTFTQEGDRVRIANPTGTDPGEVWLVDLKTKERFVVYDEAKAYYDYNKTMAALRSAMQRAERLQKLGHQRPEPSSYRALGETRVVNGFSCRMYERLVARRVAGQFCFAPWGGPIGNRQDFAWFETFGGQMAADLLGKQPRRAPADAGDNGLGLEIWSSTIAANGSREVVEIVAINRDPLPPALFQIPADYKETGRPLTPSERPTRPLDLPNALGAPPRADGRISGTVAMLLAIAVMVGLIIHAAFLHLAATVVIDRPRFMQALLAAVIFWIVQVAVWLLHLPTLLGFPVDGLATLAGLKISYNAGLWRTVALFVVSGLISLCTGWVARGFLHTLGGG